MSPKKQLAGMDTMSGSKRGPNMDSSPSSRCTTNVLPPSSDTDRLEGLTWLMKSGEW
jgi:hypothetical protein